MSSKMAEEFSKKYKMSKADLCTLKSKKAIMNEALEQKSKIQEDKILNQSIFDKIKSRKMLSKI